MVGKSRVWRGNDAHWAGRDSLYTRFSRKSSSLCSQRTTSSFWEKCGACLDCRSLGDPMLSRVFLAVLERDPSEVFPPRIQAACERAAEQPLSTKLQHDCGLAVIKRTAIQKPRQELVIQK